MTEAATTTLVEFLRQQLDAVEQRARKATPGPWKWTFLPKPDKFGLVGAPAADRQPRWVAPVPHELFPSVADGEHIAYWDPHRVLAWCEATRRQVELLRRIPCDGINFTWFERATAEELLQLLALPFSDHPDYRESWRP